MRDINEIKQDWKTILERAKKAENIIIVGASRGTDVQSFLKEHNIEVAEYFDNSDLFVGSFINGVKVSRPYVSSEKNTIYIICVLTEQNRGALTEQLIQLGVVKENIIYTPKVKSVSVLPYMSEKQMKEEIANVYFERIGKFPNLENPSTYTERTNANKIYMTNEKCTMLADKYLVKQYIKDTIGEQYVVPLLGVWDRGEDIDYDLLPEKFVLKANNASGKNIVVKDKKTLNISETNAKLNVWLTENHAYEGFELQYRDIKPKIICEEYLDGLAETVYDYQFLCFKGEPKYICCIKGSHRKGCRAAFYDITWKKQPFSVGWVMDNELAPKPSKLDEMLEISRILSKDFEHVRVDLYEMPDGRVLFGEFTFQTWGGLRRFYPPEYDLILGNLYEDMH